MNSHRHDLPHRAVHKHTALILSSRKTQRGPYHRPSRQLDLIAEQRSHIRILIPAPTLLQHKDRLLSLAILCSHSHWLRLADYLKHRFHCLVELRGEPSFSFVSRFLWAASCNPTSTLSVLSSTFRIFEIVVFITFYLIVNNTVLCRKLFFDGAKVRRFPSPFNTLYHNPHVMIHHTSFSARTYVFLHP